MSTFYAIVEALNNCLWGIPMLLLLFGTHLFLTWKTGLIQRKLPLAIRLSLTPDAAVGAETGNGDGGLSPFASLTTALASSLGVGNIVGMGTAVALGGPGAVFWCWITGFFGIATTYGEALLSLKFRVYTPDGQPAGGPMYVLEYGLRRKFAAVLFAVCGVLASFGIGCAVQVHAMADTLPVPPIITGLAVGLLTCFVIFGGNQAISRVCEKLVPFMTLFYLLGCLMILAANRAFLLPACRLILKCAFAPRAVSGGMAGSGLLLAARYGVARGLFTNEAGMGSAPLAAAAARCSDPVRQALVASTATFWDTLVVCLITGLVIVSHLLAREPALLASGVALSGSSFTWRAFSAIPCLGQPVLLFSIVTFAYATILGWSFYGERCLTYLFGPKALFPYRLCWIFTLVFAPMLELPMIFEISDLLNALMALPNLLGLLLLADVIRDETRIYFSGK